MEGTPGFLHAFVTGKRLLPLNMDTDAEPYLIEIPLGLKLLSHFFAHKGQEFSSVQRASPDRQFYRLHPQPRRTDLSDL
jgi:hypothetical protein